MVTNKDRVSMMFGREVADVLDREDCLRPDDYGVDAVPTHWLVTAKYYQSQAGQLSVPYSVNGKLRAYAHEVKNGDLVKTCLFQRRGTAQRNVTMLSNARIDVRITPMVLLEVRETK